LPVRPIYKKYTIGITIWSPLASGLLSGKVAGAVQLSLLVLILLLQYNNGIPSGSRLDTHKTMFAHILSGLDTDEGRHKTQKVKQLAEFAENGMTYSHRATRLTAG
jgi:aryl-alcohol dehydrogenase-like predicted oxidoreductase